MASKRIILVGKGASGKDHARNILQTIGMEYGVSYTTRPAREGEVNGVDYNFLSEEQFKQMDDHDKWYEYVEFNGWFYGTTKAQFHDTCNLFIMTPSGLGHLLAQDRKESYVLYFEISEDIRRERMSKRKGNADSVERRLQADEDDFKNYWNYNFMITNPNFTEDDILQAVSVEMDMKLVNIKHQLNQEKSLESVISEYKKDIDFNEDTGEINIS